MADKHKWDYLYNDSGNFSEPFNRCPYCGEDQSPGRVGLIECLGTEGDGRPGCREKYYVHPIMREFISCPSCGGYHIQPATPDAIWNMHCNDCNTDFVLNYDVDT